MIGPESNKTKIKIGSAGPIAGTGPYQTENNLQEFSQQAFEIGAQNASNGAENELTAAKD